MKLVCAEKSQVEEKLLNQNGDSLSCKLENAESVKGSIEGNHVICCVEGLAEDTQKPDEETPTTLECQVYANDQLLHAGKAYPAPTPSTLRQRRGPLLPGEEGEEDAEVEIEAEAVEQQGGVNAPELQKAMTRTQTLKKKYGALIPFAIISIAYLLFTITDGAVRMIVLLHAFQKGFTAFEVAIMFTLYEAAGVFTNLAAGMLGARWGIRSTLLAGLTIQLAGLGMLFGWQNDWSKTQAIIYVTASQTLCGVAKDLTKLGGKTVTKLVTPEGRKSSLFKLVSFITGWKNSLKGAGYFLGAATVGVNYYMSLGILCGLVLLAMPFAIFGLTNELGRARKENVTFRQLFDNNHNINVLSLSRVFLFGSRDMWFEVPLPFFLRSAASGIGWSRAATGAFLAVFIIVYGQVQSWTPQIVLQPLRQSPPDKYGAFWWALSLVVPVTILGSIMVGTDIFGPGVAQGPAIASITTLLYSFCLLFAVNSAIHSYLIVRYAEGSKVAMQVGVYYASNAMGRLTGTLLSGVLYTYATDNIVDSFGVCLFASVLFSFISAVVDVWLHEDQVGSWWLGPFNRCMWWGREHVQEKEEVEQNGGEWGGGDRVETAPPSIVTKDEK